ncbi:MAG: M48 family metallopeptidase [Huintestinicola sp.]
MNISYKLIRSSRKTISLSIGEDGTLTVRAPYKTPKSYIDSLVEQKSSWIEAHLSSVSRRKDIREERLNRPPAELPYLGGLAPVTDAEPYGFDDGCFRLPHEFTLVRLLPYLEKLYKRLAAEYIIPRAMELAALMGEEDVSFHISSAKTRWGSCSAGRSINFSWRLIAASPQQIDYVIVHELCHIGQMDHSGEFWKKVEKYIPDYRLRRDELKKIQSILSEYGLE